MACPAGIGISKIRFRLDPRSGGGGESVRIGGRKDDGGEDKARSPHYFVQITHAAVICKIPVILHFKLENKTAWLAAAYPLHGISMLSPPVTLTLLRKPTTAENYCTALRSVRIIFFFSSPSLFPLFSFAPPSYARHPPLLSISAFDLRSLETRTFRIGAERERERAPMTAEDSARKFEILSTSSRRFPTLSTQGR